MSTNNTKQATWVAIGSLFSFIVGIVSPMILSRYFEKTDYGTYKQVMYVYHTLLVVFTLGLPRAYSYFIPKRPIEQAKNIINRISSIFIVLGVLFTVFLFTLAGPIAQILNNPDLEDAIRLFSPVPLFLLPTMGLDGIYASFNKTQITAIYTVVTRVFTVFCTVLPVILFSGGVKGAIIGFDIASLLTFLLAFVLMRIPTKGVKAESTDVTYKQIIMFALPLMYASIWGMIINASPSFFISRYFGSETFADFSNGFMSVPFMGMITTSVATVLLPAFSRLDQENGIDEKAYVLWDNTITKTTKVIFPMLIYCIFFSKPIVTLMYGDLYEGSAIYFIIKNLANMFYIIPFAPILISLGKTKQYANIHIISAIMVVSIQLLSIFVFRSSVLVAAISSFCEIVLVLLMLGQISKSLSVGFFKLIPFKKIIAILLSSLVAGVASFITCRYFNLDKILTITAGFVFFLLIYYVLCWILHITYRDFSGSLLKGKSLALVNKILP